MFTSAAFTAAPAADHAMLKKHAAGFKHDMGSGKDRYAQLASHFNGLGQAVFCRGR